MRNPLPSVRVGVALYSCVLVVGCASLAEYHVGPLAIRSDTIPGSGRVQSICIDFRGSSGDTLMDAWIETHKHERLKLADITPAMLIARGATEWRNRDAHIRPEDPDEAYVLRGLRFTYRQGKLWQFSMNPEAFALGKQETAPRIGLTRSGGSVTLPCSRQEFESVFGKIESKVQN